MIGRIIIIFFILSILSDFAFSYPKLEKRKLPAYNSNTKHHHRKFWARQGLAHSVESLEHSNSSLQHGSGNGEPVIDEDVGNNEDANKNEDVYNIEDAGNNEEAGNNKESGNNEEAGNNEVAEKNEEAGNHEDEYNNDDGGNHEDAGNNEDTGNNEDADNNEEAGNNADAFKNEDAGNNADTYNNEEAENNEKDDKIEDSYVNEDAINNGENYAYGDNNDDDGHNKDADMNEKAEYNEYPGNNEDDQIIMNSLEEPFDETKVEDPGNHVSEDTGAGNDDGAIDYTNVGPNYEEYPYIYHDVEQIAETFDVNSNEDMKMQLKFRSLQVGDTFTPREMLTVAKKLMQKVRNPGEGKGIVSSAEHPNDLADNLFERFFLTMERIVIVKVVDVPALDALQALASAGDETSLRSAASSITESPRNAHGGKQTEMKPRRKCLYKVLRKAVGNYARRYGPRNKSKRRNRVNIMKKLAKKRKLVVNPARRRPAQKNMKRGKTNKNIMRVKSKTVRGNIKRTQRNQNLKMKRLAESKPKNMCRWKYNCSEPNQLASCRVYSDCSKEARSGRKYSGLPTNDLEETEDFRRFRRMVGFEVIDEEIEKILERRYKELRPYKQEHDARFENLSEYFNKLVITEFHDAIRQNAVKRLPILKPYNSVSNTNPDVPVLPEADYQPDRQVPGPERRVVPGFTKVTPKIKKNIQ